jgi:tRNA(fMet)-specific endonuclease VapC
MIQYLLDTNHIGSLLRDEKAPLWFRLQAMRQEQVLLCRPSVGELWFMVYNSSRIDSNRGKLAALLDQFRIFEFDAAAAEEFGRIRAELRKTGRHIPQIDVQIAAIARQNSFVAVTADAHFSNVEGLSTENWIAQ